MASRCLPTGPVGDMYFNDRDMCFPSGRALSLGICVSQVREHTSLGIRVSQVGKHISLGIRVSQVGEHISLGIRVSQVAEHISLGIRVSQVGNTYHKGYVFPR